MRPPRRPPGWPFSCRVEKFTGTRVASAFTGGVAVTDPTRDTRGKGSAVSRLLVEIFQAPRWTSPPPGASRSRPGDVVGRYQIRREIGRGGFGAVYEAFDPELGRTVALKALKPGRTRSTCLRGVDPEGGRGGREARPPGHRHHLRRGDVPGGRVPRDGAAAGRDAGEADREGTAAGGRGPAHRRADGGGARARPFTGRAAPGPEARERLRLRGRAGEAARLRPGAPARDGGVERRRDAGVHGAGAGGGGGGRRAGRRLGGGDGAGGDAHREAAGGEDADAEPGAASRGGRRRS